MTRIFAALLLALSVLGGSAALALPASAAPTQPSTCVNGVCCYNGQWEYGRYQLGGEWWNPNSGTWHYGRYYAYTFGGGMGIATRPPAGTHCH